MQYVKKNLKIGKLISLCNNIPFIFECFHNQQDCQWHEKELRRHQTKNSQNGPNIFLSDLESIFIVICTRVLSNETKLMLAVILK